VTQCDNVTVSSHMMTSHVVTDTLVQIGCHLRFLGVSFEDEAFVEGSSEGSSSTNWGSSFQ